MFLAIQSLNREELLRILRCAKLAREGDWLVIMVHFWHGLRNSEVRALTGDSIHNGYLENERLKGSESGVQALVVHPNPLLDERKVLIDYASKSVANQPLFKMCRQTYWRHVRAHALAAGIAKHKAKTTVLKHTLATLMIENAPINKVQRRRDTRRFHPPANTWQSKTPMSIASSWRQLGFEFFAFEREIKNVC